MGVIEWILGMLNWLLLDSLRAILGSSSRSASEYGPPVDMGMYSVLHILDRVQQRIQATAGSSSQLVAEDVPLPRLQKVNDHVYEVCKPRAWRPLVELVFFHGLQLENSRDAHITTWVSRDKEELWLNWLLEDFPDARILTVSYDAFARQTGDQGTTDMYITRENLVSSLTGSEGGIGQDGCPVVLVGHCLGGLVMKELLVQANSILSLNRRDRLDERVQNLLENVKGVFFYASPNHGSGLADRNKESWKGPLFEGLTTLNKETARRNEDFRKLREKHGWKTSGVGESREVTLKNFTGIVVPEASARYDVDNFYTIDADHFNVCRPVSRTSAGYQLLSKFVADVLKEDKVRFSTESDLPSKVVGLKAGVEIVQEKLRGARRLGIVGIGGIGKTTLAKAVYDIVSERFEYACLVAEVKKSMADEEKPADLRAKIVDRLYRRGRKVPEAFDWSILKGKKVLIILDDAEFESQVVVMTESDGFSEESRVVVTSRDRGFLVPLDFEFHEAKQLCLEDSKRLFCLHAFRMTEAPHPFKERVTRFAAKCGGLPLALKVAGRYLYRRNEAAWDDGFEKLSRAQSLNGSVVDGLWSILRVSYESLAPPEREMFLDVATCFHGEKLKQVQAAWRVCGWASADSGWENLLDRCLVSKDDGRIWMHEVLRDLGRSIACPDPHNIASHSRVFDIRVASQLLDQEKAAVKVLKIDCLKHFFEADLALDVVALSGLKELKVLWLEGVVLAIMDGLCALLPSRLVFLKWSVLSIRGQDVVVPYLQQCPEIQSPRSLFLKSTSLVQRTGSLGQLPLLEHLDLRALRHLSIRYGYALKALPDTLENLRALQHLEITYCNGLKALPDTLGDLQALRYLKIKTCSSLRAIPDTLGYLHMLQHLEIRECDSLKALPDSLGNLRALQHLVITQCPRLKALPDNIGELRALQHLEIRFCDFLIALPDSFGHLQALQHLKIETCQCLKALPDSLGDLRALQHLEIHASDSLQAIPDTLGNLLVLEHLKILEFNSLKALPNTLGELRALQHLEIISCISLEALPDALGDLQALRHLTVSHLTGLKAMPDTLGQLSSLQSLRIIECDQLVKLPDSFGQLPQLQKLEIYWCENLEQWRPSLEQLGQVQELELTYLSRRTRGNLRLQRQNLGDLSDEHCGSIGESRSDRGEGQSLGYISDEDGASFGQWALKTTVLKRQEMLMSFAAGGRSLREAAADMDLLSPSRSGRETKFLI